MKNLGLLNVGCLLPSEVIQLGDWRRGDISIYELFGVWYKPVLPDG